MPARVQAFGFDHARVDRIDANLARAKLLGQRLGDRIDGRLGAAIDRGGGDRRMGHDRADVDDRAAGRAEMLGGFLRSQDQAEHVEIELLVEVLGRDVFERGKLIDARVVDEDVELVELVLRFGEQPLDVGRVGDVGLNGHRLAAILRDLADDAVGGFLAGGVVDDDGRAFGREMPGDGCADSLRGAGDDGHFAEKLLGHDMIPLTEA